MTGPGKDNDGNLRILYDILSSAICVFVLAKLGRVVSDCQNWYILGLSLLRNKRNIFFRKFE